jgi:hypothetical protein
MYNFYKENSSQNFAPRQFKTADLQSSLSMEKGVA